MFTPLKIEVAKIIACVKILILTHLKIKKGSQIAILTSLLALLLKDMSERVVTYIRNTCDNVEHGNCY